MATPETGIQDPLLAPISGPNPAGVDLQWEPEWFNIVDARRWDDATLGLKEPKAADWRAVHDLSSSALANKSKDLLLAIYFMEAKLKLEGLAGLRDGLELIAGLIALFWDKGLYPPWDGDSPIYRARALEWINEKMPEALAEVSVTNRKDGAQDYTYGQYMESRRVGYERNLLDERGDLDEEKARRRKEALDAGYVSGEVFDAAVKATPRAWYEALMPDLSGARQALGHLDRVVKEKFERERPSLTMASAALSSWQDAIGKMLEQKRLEEPADEPPAIPKKNTAPNLPNISLPAVPPSEDEGLGGAWERAQALVGAGQVQEGLAEMTRLASQDHGRNRFLRRLALAEACLTTGRDRIAILVLEELSEQIRSMNLAQWESPDLIARVWGRLYRHYLPLSDSRASDLYLQLSRLDPWQALRWGEG